MSRNITPRVVAIVWTLRVLIGAVFVISGMAKMIDVWGFVYKIEQYLNVWSWPQPRALVVGGAVALSAVEFLLGWFLVTGCYKRVTVWAMSLVMAFMLPLTFYIMVANPVSDCGCFGDFIVISNSATFIKNILIAAGLVYLWRYNYHVSGMFTRYSQWLVGFLALVYAVVVGIIGYNFQPMIDFRPYPVGKSLLASQEETGDDAVSFIYEKDGQSKEFSAEELPDSTWTFVERVEAAVSDDDRQLTIYDGDDDVTYDVISTEGTQLVVLIPDLKNVDASSTYLINDMNRYVSSHGGNMIAVLATDDRGVELWRDFSMASYDIFTAEDTAIKEVARGNVAVVCIKDGIVEWKRTLSSIDGDSFASDADGLLDNLNYSGTGLFWFLTLLFLGAELVVWAIDRSGKAVKLHFSRKNRKK